MTSRRVLLAGNPGVGKSTLCNGFVGKVLFKSGDSIGTGVTTVVQSAVVGDTTYIDSPGLADVATHAKAKEEIFKALSQDGSCCLIFVCTLESGRVRKDTIETIQTILDSLHVPNPTFGVVINKVTPTLNQRIQTDTSIKVGLKENIETCGYSLRMRDLYIYPRDDTLEGMENGVPKLSPDFCQFVTQLEPIPVIARNVTPLISRKEKEQEEQRKQLEKEKEEFKRTKEQQRQEIIREEQRLRDARNSGGDCLIL